MTIQYVIAIHLLRWLTNFYDFTFKWTATAVIGIHTLLKPDCHRWWISKMQSGHEDTLEERYAIKFCFKLGKNATETYGMLQTAFGPRDSVPSGSMLAIPHSRRPDRANPPTNFWWSLFWQHWYDLHTLYSRWTDSQQEILCCGFKGVQEKIPSEEANTLQIGSVAFLTGQCTSLQLHLVTDYLTKMGMKTVSHSPYSSDIAPCDFWLFPKLRGFRYKTIEEMKEAVTKVIDTLILPWGLPEVVGTGEQVHCSQRRLLQRGVEFHVCTINKSGHTKKSGNLLKAHCSWIHPFPKKIRIKWNTNNLVLDLNSRRLFHFVRQ